MTTCVNGSLLSLHSPCGPDSSGPDSTVYGDSTTVLQTQYVTMFICGGFSIHMYVNVTFKVSYRKEGNPAHLSFPPQISE